MLTGGAGGNLGRRELYVYPQSVVPQPYKLTHKVTTHLVNCKRDVTTKKLVAMSARRWTSASVGTGCVQVKVRKPLSRIGLYLIILSMNDGFSCRKMVS